MPIFIAALLAAAPTEPAPIEVVRGFLEQVRSGRHPEAAPDYMAAQVAAHQLTAEAPATVLRTPQDYAEHVREFGRLFGNYQLTVDEIFAAGDRVFVRWHQSGRHLGSVDGEAPTGKPVTEISSVVYRVSNGRIVEYWIQTDRKGLERQLAPARP